MQWVLLECTNRRRVVIINIYRPPQGDYKADYKAACKSINDALNKANLKDNVEIFLLGDFNINMKDRGSALTKELVFTTSLWNLKPVIKESTRFGIVDGRLVESCIDSIFTNSENAIDPKTLDWNLSDHLAVSVTRKRLGRKFSKVSFSGRSYKNYDKNLFQRNLIDENWDSFYDSNSPSDCWDIMEGKIRLIINRMCPLKTFSVKEVREPWITNELLEEIKDKDRALKTAKHTKKPDDMRVAREARNRVGRLVGGARADFLKEQQQELPGDPKKFWRLVKSIVPNAKASTGKISLMDEELGGRRMREDEVAEHINNFFTDIGPKLASKIGKNSSEDWVFLGQKSNASCPNFRSNFAQIQHILRSISTTKSSGIKDLSSRVCKDAFLVLVPQIVFMFNLSFDTSLFPDKWKEATVIPLYKGGKKTEVGNYRPISLLPIMGKVMEKVVHANLAEFLNNHGILSEKQGGLGRVSLQPLALQI